MNKLSCIILLALIALGGCIRLKKVSGIDTKLKEDAAALALTAPVLAAEVHTGREEGDEAAADSFLQEEFLNTEMVTSVEQENGHTPAQDELEMAVLNTVADPSSPVNKAMKTFIIVRASHLLRLAEEGLSRRQLDQRSEALNHDAPLQKDALMKAVCEAMATERKRWPLADIEKFDEIGSTKLEQQRPEIQAAFDGVYATLMNMSSAVMNALIRAGKWSGGQSALIEESEKQLRDRLSNMHVQSLNNFLYILMKAIHAETFVSDEATKHELNESDWTEGCNNCTLQ